MNRFVFLLVCLCLALLPATAQQTDTLREMRRQIDVLTEEIERLKLGEVAEPRYEAQRGLGPAAARVYQLRKTGVSIAGYGEAVYENFSKKRENGTSATTTDKIDFLRSVVYSGYRYNDWIVFNSEIEFEHASTGKSGEVSVEFAYVELSFSEAFNLRAGMVLPPVGIVNEKHEPSTFFGTLRPSPERSVIPSTWRTNGVGAYGSLGGGFHYRAYVVEGLNAAKFSDADGLRGGRQSGSNALAEDLAATGKLEYTGLEGATIGASFYTGNSGQGQKDSLGTVDARTLLWSVHGEYAWKGLELRALYAAASVDQADRVSGLAGKVIGKTMNGWYVVAGYDLMPLLNPGSLHVLSPFVQFEQVNTHASMGTGYTANKAFDRSTLVVGVTYKPHPNVAFKVDYRDNKNKAVTGVSQWNAAVNYLF